VGYNLPDDCTQGDIDRALGGTHPDWVCEDPECRAGWVGDIEAFPCEIDECAVHCCGECRTVCWGCDKVACSEHRLVIKGEVWCLSCRDEYEEENEMDFTRATELTPEAAAAIDDAFEYHKWDEIKTAMGAGVRAALADAVKVIVSCVPPSPDRTTAIRKIREARMDCNSAITHGGKY
jgi:hypothetical protein